MTPIDLPIYLWPGKHTVEISKQNYTTYTTTVQLTAGQHLAVKLPLDSNLKEKPAVKPVVNTCSTCPPPPKPRSCPECKPLPVGPATVISRPRTIAAWVALGVGGALAVTGAIVYGVGLKPSQVSTSEGRTAASPALPRQASIPPLGLASLAQPC